MPFLSKQETPELFGKDPNYDLIMPNGIIRHCIVFIEAEEVRKLVIPIGITQSERVNHIMNFEILPADQLTRKFILNPTEGSRPALTRNPNSQSWS